MYKMINGIQYYDWGSKVCMTMLYNIANPQQKPMAEMWMGAHPLLSSQIITPLGIQSLYDAIKANPDDFLGSHTAQLFKELPFLFKLLTAEKPLSIQVHPNKIQAEQGFAKENQQQILLTANHRNYKDANHKPELLYALTPFKAINGFRCFHEIALLMYQLANNHFAIKHFIKQPNETNLQAMFTTLLSLSGVEKKMLLHKLKQLSQQYSYEPWSTIHSMIIHYPDDIGLFAPLMMNLIELKPGEAMFLYAGTPHAYLHGCGLEAMANSDNVLRAGLTNKHIDLPELVANVNFIEKESGELLIHPTRQSIELSYPIPVKDFAFSIYTLCKQALTLNIQSGTIIFVITGEAHCEQQHCSLTLKAGESCFITPNKGDIQIQGTGNIARIYNK